MHMSTAVAMGKFKIGVCQGVPKPYFEPFLISEILCLFLHFSILESCYTWLVSSLEYPSAYVYSCCPGKNSKSESVRGVSGGT